MTSPPSTATVPAAPAPALTVVKTASPGHGDRGRATRSPTRFRVTNTGNVTLDGVTVAETAFSGTGTAARRSPARPPRWPRAQSTTCTATYTVTQADVDAGSVTNTATATGTAPGGGTVTSPPSTATVPAAPAPALTLVKTAGPGDGDRGRGHGHLHLPR